MSELFRETLADAIDRPDQLGEQITLDVGTLCQVNIARDQDVSGGADLTKDRLRIFSSSVLSPGDEATMDATIAAFAPTTPTSEAGLIAPTPVSNTWTPIPNTGLVVAEETLVSGRVTVRCWVGADYVPCGATLTFAASRASGEAVAVESWGVPGGRVPQFAVRLSDNGTDTITVEIRRRGSSDVRVRADFESTAEGVPS